MKKVVLFFGILVGINTHAQLPQLGKAQLKDVISAMTMEEKARMVFGASTSGIDNSSPVLLKQALKSVPGVAGVTAPIPRFGITPALLADGPAGLRIESKRANTDATFYCTNFPVATVLASTWNKDLVQNVGEAMGNETFEYGADVLLAPGLNIHRNPLCGRNFEYYSEDPLLAGKTAAAFVRGVQSQGVGTAIKHFACNNQETNRMNTNAIVSQRALRELYLKNFEIAVKESNPWTVMTSYNKLNGRYTSETPELINTILRDEWGFKGMVMSDWHAGTNPVDQMLAGNDLLEPGKKADYDTVLNGMKSGKLPVSVVENNIEHILEMVQKTPRFNGHIPTNKPDLKAHALITRQSATEGLVLLKNERSALPLKSSLKNVALFGVYSYDLFVAGGAGSGQVNRAYTVNLQQGLANGNIPLEPNALAMYSKYIGDSMATITNYNTTKLWHLPPYVLTEMAPSESDVKTSATNSDLAIITLGRNSGEGFDRKIKYDYELTDNEKKLLINVCDVFHKAGKKVVVILNICGPLETASWKNLPDAILVAWQPGQEGGNSIVDVLKGKENPSGKLPMTFSIKYEDEPSAKNFPSEYTDELYGKTDKKRNIDYINYEERIYVGYRHYSTIGKPVSYPFGFGLSYTSFKYGNLKVTAQGEDIVASVTISNTGKVAGKEVAELYITAPKGKLDKPKYELKAFTKTKLLQPAESQTVELVFHKSELASFDESLSSWVADAGNYTISVGASVADIRSKGVYNLSEKWEKKVKGW